MGLLSNLFGRGGEKTYRWKPLRCMPSDIVDLMRECERIEAPIVGLEVELDGVRQHVGMSSDYERDRGFFDTVWYVDDDEYPSGASPTLPSRCWSFATSSSATRAATSSSRSASSETKGTGSFVSFEILLK